jgi:hypothetical protein
LDGLTLFASLTGFWGDRFGRRSAGVKSASSICWNVESN